ncbi:MAG: hypothetical protein JSS86_00880 [Cyanobacteria bacterium SZAS LIN-2]|nr:hypothetical protein [Cyanobacteria bacterium SZAS LIN-3]MBS1994824.1 hypothetical protein [Cyanobacteria bacterium SZAS LIN-2]
MSDRVGLNDILENQTLGRGSLPAWNVNDLLYGAPPPRPQPVEAQTQVFSAPRSVDTRMPPIYMGGSDAPFYGQAPVGPGHHVPLPQSHEKGLVAGTIEKLEQSALLLGLVVGGLTVMSGRSSVGRQVSKAVIDGGGSALKFAFKNPKLSLPTAAAAYLAYEFKEYLP